MHTHHSRAHRQRANAAAARAHTHGEGPSSEPPRNRHNRHRVGPSSWPRDPAPRGVETDRHSTTASAWQARTAGCQAVAPRVIPPRRRDATPRSTIRGHTHTSASAIPSRLCVRRWTLVPSPPLHARAPSSRSPPKLASPCAPLKHLRSDRIDSCTCFLCSLSSHSSRSTLLCANRTLTQMTGLSRSVRMSCSAAQLHDAAQLELSVVRAAAAALPCDIESIHVLPLV